MAYLSTRPLLKGSPTPQGGVLWPVGGWVSLVWGNLAQSASPPPPWGGGRVWVGGWVGGWVGTERMVRQPLFVQENTIFTERTVVKSGKISGPQPVGFESTLCQFDSATIYH